MKKFVSTVVSAFLIISAVSFLTGCGGSTGSSGATSGSDPSTGHGVSAPFGDLALSGAGSDITGTTFNAWTRIADQWYNIDLAAGVTYPFVVVVVMRDPSGSIVGVTVSKMIDSKNASGQWFTNSLSAPQFSATNTSVTFAGLELPGYGVTPMATSLILNGTLNY